MLSDLSVGERSGRVIVREGFGNEARTVPLNASARLALAVYLAPQWEFVEKKYRDPIYTQRSAHFAVIWYVVSFRQKYTDRPIAEADTKEVGMAEVSITKIGHEEVGAAEVSVAEIGTDKIRSNSQVLFSPRIPHGSALLEQLHLFVVCH